MQQTDEILARFPGPLRLTMSFGRRLLGLAIFIGIGAFMAWLLFGEEDRGRYLSGNGEVVMAWFSLAVFAMLVVRCAILLLAPRRASLTLDGEGFEIGQIFRRIRSAWRDVDGFSVETKYLRGGRLQQVVGYDSAAKARRVMGEFYGRPRLKADELAGLMNAWRARVLGLPLLDPRKDAQRGRDETPTSPSRAGDGAGPSLSPDARAERGL